VEINYLEEEGNVIHGDTASSGCFGVFVLIFNDPPFRTYLIKR